MTFGNGNDQCVMFKKWLTDEYNGQFEFLTEKDLGGTVSLEVSIEPSLYKAVSGQCKVKKGTDDPYADITIEFVNSLQGTGDTIEPAVKKGPLKDEDDDQPQVKKSQKEESKEE